MKISVKFTLLLCTLGIIAGALTGCGYRGYRGKHDGAYTLFLCQVPDTLGAMPQGPILSDPEILPLDSDSEGRTLYLYLEDTDKMLSIGIVQKQAEGKVYFYPECSTLSFRVPVKYYDLDNSKHSESELLLMLDELCDKESLDKLKSDNDWSMPINESKLDSADITSQKIPTRWGSRDDEVDLFDGIWLDEIMALAKKNGYQITTNEYAMQYFSHSCIMDIDEYGRRLYYAEAYYYDYPEEGNISYIKHTIETIAIINPDGTYEKETFIAELRDKANYQDQIRELKAANGWNTPIE